MDSRPSAARVKWFSQSAPFWVVVGAVGSAAVTAVGFRWIGAISGAEGFGRATLFYSAVLLGVGCTATALAQSVMRLTLDGRTRAERSDIFVSALALGAVAALGIATVGILALVMWRTQGGGVSALASAALAVALPAEALKTIAAGQLSGLSRFRDVGVAQFADVASRPFLVVTLSGWITNGTEVVLVGYSAAAVLGCLLHLTFVFLHLGPGRPRQPWIAKHVRYGYPLVANGLFGWLVASADRYVVAAAIDVRAAGIYVGCLNLGAKPAGMLGGLIETYLRPRLYADLVCRDAGAFRRTAARWLRLLAWTILPALIGLALLHPIVISLLLAPEFRPGAAPLLITGFAAFGLVSLGMLAQRTSYGLGRTWDVPLVEVIGTGLILASLFVGGAIADLPGVALGLLVGSAGRTAVAFAVAWRGLGRSLPEFRRALLQGPKERLS